MAHEALVYGCICAPAWKTDDFYQLHRLNKTVLQSLPENDTTFPCINRSMFSIPNEQGIYHQQVIAFGASYRNLEYEWHIWLDKFESILRTLYWWDIRLVTEFEIMGTYTYHWNVSPDQQKIDFMGSPQPVSAWQFSSDGPRHFELT